MKQNSVQKILHNLYASSDKTVDVEFLYKKYQIGEIKQQINILLHIHYKYINIHTNISIQ